MTSQRPDDVAFFLLKILRQDNSKRFLFHDLDKILSTALPDTTKICTYIIFSRSWQDLAYRPQDSKICAYKIMD